MRTPYSTTNTLMTTLALTKGQYYSYKILYSLVLDLEAGDIVENIVSQFEMTNDLKFNVMLAHRIILTTDSAATEVTTANKGYTLALAAGENITPDMHHGFRSLNGIPTVIKEAGMYYMNVIVYAASTAAVTGNKLSVPANYGHLACVVSREV